MFIAHDENHNIIPIENATRGNHYFCPTCGEHLIVKAENSLAVHKHFAHRKGTQCTDDWNYDMSEWHRAWQAKFPIECREVVKEKDGVKHRADVLINQTVIEFQHSPITSEEIAKRNDFYRSLGYQVVWVFDAEGQIKNSVGESLDPYKCSPTDLRWKRAKEQFSKPFPNEVDVFLDYSTEISIPHEHGQTTRILLWLNRIDPNIISFHRLATKEQLFYISQYNFLKEYGALTDSSVLSITDILISLCYPKQKKSPADWRQILRWAEAANNRKSTFKYLPYRRHPRF